MGLRFSILSFNVASVYILPQSNDIYKSSDMLNKNILGVKKYEANKKQPYLCATKSFDISSEAKTSLIKDVSNYLNDMQ